ncbi:MAG TPA: FUSC family protein [Nitrososphaeraceae archaeon]|nr:FUSC family protein [Nitrososphaeraceae archaeon]
MGSWQDKFKLLTCNLSIHSQYFQNALVLAITGVVGILITQWFDISEGDWILITIVIILMPAYTDISLTFNKIVHRLIGTTIGAITAAIIINNIDNQWLLSLFLFLFASIFVSCSMKTKNYAFELIFLTAIIIITDVILEPITYSTPPLARIENIFIGCLLSLVAAFIIWIIRIERKPNYRAAE